MPTVGGVGRQGLGTAAVLGLRLRVSWWGLWLVQQLCCGQGQRALAPTAQGLREAGRHRRRPPPGQEAQGRHARLQAGQQFCRHGLPGCMAITRNQPVQPGCPPRPDVCLQRQQAKTAAGGWAGQQLRPHMGEAAARGARRPAPVDQLRHVAHHGGHHGRWGQPCVLGMVQNLAQRVAAGGGCVSKGREFEACQAAEAGAHALHRRLPVHCWRRRACVQLHSKHACLLHHAQPA